MSQSDHESNNIEPHTELDPNTIDYNDIIENVSSEMIGYVSENPNYVQCLLHIKAYRDYHRGEKDEFNERIEVLDERYKRYNTIIDSTQIMIIVFSAGAAFVQGGNSLFNISDNILRFIGLCISSWTALALSIAKYYKLDEQKENMNNLRQQCSDLVSELGAREDRLNTLCSKEIWAGPPGAPPPPAVTAWENERDEMYNSLKTMIQKKQTLVAVFDQIMDSQESKKLILASKNKSLFYKREKLKLDKLFLEYRKEKNEHNETKLQIDDRTRKYPRKLADMSKIQTNGMFNAQSAPAGPVSQMHYFSPQQTRLEMYNKRDTVDSAHEQIKELELDMQQMCQREAAMTKHIIELRQQNHALHDEMNAPRDEETGHGGILSHSQLPSNFEHEESNSNHVLGRVNDMDSKDEQVRLRKLDEARNYHEGQKDRQRVERELAANKDMSSADKQETLDFLKATFPKKEELENKKNEERADAKAQAKNDVQEKKSVIKIINELDGLGDDSKV